MTSSDVILVLSGSSEYIERTGEAADLFKKGLSRKIFLTNDGLQSGWNQEEQRNPYFAERARRELIRQGVPEESIEILSQVVSGTDDEAELFAGVVAERHIKSVMLVTSSYHTYRTLWIFEKVAARNNLSVKIGIKHPETENQTLSPFLWWLSYKGWKKVGLEYLKIVYYKFSY